MIKDILHISAKIWQFLYKLFNQKKTMKKLISKIEAWVAGAKETAKNDINKVIAWLNKLPADIDAAKAELTKLEEEAPAWAKEIESFLNEALILLPSGIVKTLIASILANIQNIANNIPEPAPAPAPAEAAAPATTGTPSKAALLTMLNNISESANNILKVAPIANSNVTAIRSMVTNATALVDKVIEEAQTA